MLGLWDTAPEHEDYDRLRPLSYPQTDVFILCFSITSRYSFEAVKSKWWPELKQHAPGSSISFFFFLIAAVFGFSVVSEVVFSRSVGVPLLLCGSNSDARSDDALTLQEKLAGGRSMVTQQEAQACARDIGAVEYLEFSALTQEGLMNVGFCVSFSFFFLCAKGRCGLLQILHTACRLGLKKPVSVDVAPVSFCLVRSSCLCFDLYPHAYTRSF